MKRETEEQLELMERRLGDQNEVERDVYDNSDHLQAMIDRCDRVLLTTNLEGLHSIDRTRFDTEVPIPEPASNMSPRRQDPTAPP